MEEMAISKFKATCLAVIERVRKTGKPVLVTRHGEPVAQILPPPIPERRSGYGCAREATIRIGDVVSPLPPEDWGLE